jgi:hypothetical protein
LNDNRQFWADLAASRDQLPTDDEALLASVSAMTVRYRFIGFLFVSFSLVQAERTFVPLQMAASTNNPSAFAQPPRQFVPTMEPQPQ